jgi:hypothetical protein
MSQSQTPLLHEVIPLFDIITGHLDKYVDNTDNFPAVRAAARRGRAMMNKYYGLTDDSIMYRIVMCKWFVFVCNIYKLIFLDSTSSALQVIIFREGKMATRLDYDCRRYIER